MHFSNSTMRQAYHRQHRKCGFCGVHLEDDEHVNFANRDGRHTNLDNCVILCEPCLKELDHNHGFRSGAPATSVFRYWQG
jgi:5-methylcytosine-specific restriction endonuclease McrA